MTTEPNPVATTAAPTRFALWQRPRKAAVTWIAAVLLLVLAAPAHTDGYQDGIHYDRISDVAEDKSSVEIIEYFSYACPFCADFHPLLSEWMEERGDDVTLRRVPLAFRDDWEALARGYHAADEQDAVDAIHGPMFRALHEQGRSLDRRDAILDFLEEQGLDRDAAARAWEGFGVERALSRDARLAERHGIDSTPSVVVAGAYRVGPRMAGSLPAMIDIMDALVDRHAEAAD